MCLIDGFDLVALFGESPSLTSRARECYSYANSRPGDAYRSPDENLNRNLDDLTHLPSHQFLFGFVAIF